MKKAIIAAVIIAATGVTALSVAKSLDSKPEVKVTKVDKADFLNKGGFSNQKNDVSSAD